MPDPTDLEYRRKRLIYRSHHTGTHETDLLLGRFADAHVPGMTARDLDDYEALIDNADPDLWNWISGRVAVPAAYDTPVFRSLCAMSFTPNDY